MRVAVSCQIITCDYWLAEELMSRCKCWETLDWWHDVCSIYYRCSHFHRLLLDLSLWHNLCWSCCGSWIYTISGRSMFHLWKLQSKSYFPDSLAVAVYFWGASWRDKVLDRCHRRLVLAELSSTKCLLDVHQMDVGNVSLEYVKHSIQHVEPLCWLPNVSFWKINSSYN